MRERHREGEIAVPSSAEIGRPLCDNLVMETLHETAPSERLSLGQGPVSRAACVRLDSHDELGLIRQRFAIPENTVYLDGNSLGALPRATTAAINNCVQEQWGKSLIASWNSANWVNLPQTVARRLAPILGVGADEVIIADSTSVNLFKLLAGILMYPALRTDTRRRYILSEEGNFPTDLYIAEGVIRMLGPQYELKIVASDKIEASMDETVAAALITHVDYRSGYMHPMRTLNENAAKAGVHIVWDLSHSAGAVPLNLQDDGTVFAVGCGYKYLNGGPGAPAYAYVRQDWQTKIATPLSGWFGHETPFDFAAGYTPAPNIRRLLCGTPSVLAMVALDCGLATFEDVDLAQLRLKSLALSDTFWRLMDEQCAGLGFNCVSPQTRENRGSHLSFAHEHAYPIMRAIIDRGVIGDFRQPNLLRFGFTPLYTRFVDCWDAVATIREVVLSGAYRASKYQTKHQVT